ESYHKVKYTTSSLKAAVELSQRYLNDRFLPDKAIDIIDDVGAAYTMKKQPCTKNIIDRHDVEKIVAKIAQVPCKQINISDRKLLSNLDDKIKRMVYGQDNAIGKVVNAIKLSRSGLNSPNKPAGCFFFNGPTGVGKTEVAIQLAKCLGLKLIRFDMSEFMEKHTSSQLVGAPAGYVGFEQGGLLTESIIKHPHSILLLDEIEKSHPEIVNLLLQIMDYGKLTDNNGRSADFQNVTIIMTSNTGAKNLVNQNIGFMDQDNSSEGDIAVKKNFPPEFRNRLDAIVQFNSLDDKSILLVINKFITQLEVQLESQKIHLEVSESVKHWIASEGYQEGMGARPISRVIDQEIKRIIADKIIMGDMPSGSTIKVSLHNHTVKVRANSH
nr:AAA family ATPase [Pelagibacterales bacterium]